MKMIKFIAAPVVLLAAALTAHSQVQYTEEVRMRLYNTSHPIDWRLDKWESNTSVPQRYTLAVQPFYLLKSGLRFDFEKELRKPGRWLQAGLMGYVTPKGSEDRNWKNLLSGYDPFDKLRGAGFSLAYKTMLGHSGFHYNVGLQYNFYHVGYKEDEYFPFTENGLPMLEYREGDFITNYHQPAVFVNAGKHMAISKHVFVDMYLGLGYMHSFHSGEMNIFDGYTNFGYRGVYFSCGFRLGVVWGRK